MRLSGTKTRESNIMRASAGAGTRAASPAVARARPRKADSASKTPFPAVVPKPPDTFGSNGAALVPAHVRAAKGDLGRDDVAYIRRKLGMKLGKFASSIVRVSVRTLDMNGPRGGIDQICRIKVVLYKLPSVVFEKRHASGHAAVDGALAGIERAVRRALRRRRLRPRRGAAGSRPRSAAEARADRAHARRRMRPLSGVS